MPRKSFHQELEELKNDVLRMGTLVETAICHAVASLAEHDTESARKVIEADDAIDEMHFLIEDRCLTMLALQQPMASDLRMVGTALKIVTDLERIGDLATDIARVTLALEGQPYIKPLIDIPRMANLTMKMTHDVLSAYVNRDIKIAYDLRALEKESDDLYKQVFRELLLIMMEKPSNIRQATHFLFVAAHLERVGDHVMNIAEWVIYMVTGKRIDLNDPTPGSDD